MKPFKPVACFILIAGLMVTGCARKSENEAGPLHSGSGVQGIAGNFNPQPGGAATPGSAQDFRTSLDNKVHFSTDSAKLSPEAKKILVNQAAWMKTYTNTLFSMQGHSDERGTREYNISLSARRANSVKSFLQNQGIESNRLSIIAFGKERPIEVCAASRCWNQNRRVETVLK